MQTYAEDALWLYLGKVVSENRQEVPAGKLVFRETLEMIENALIFILYNYTWCVDDNIKKTTAYAGEDLRILNTGTIPPNVRNFEINRKTVIFIDYIDDLITP